MRGHLAATGSQALAELVADLRGAAGLSQRRLAVRAGVHRSTIQRIEGAAIRVRPSTLGWVAHALDPDRRAEILGRLTEAADDRLAADTPGWTRYRRHAQERMCRDGVAALPTAVSERLRLFAVSEAMTALALALGAAALELGAGDARCWAMWDLQSVLLDESQYLVSDGGTPVYGARVPERRRGDPADASVLPPPAWNLDGVRQWVREWQVRQGRAQPRTARERAVAATGTAIRARIARASPVRVIRVEDIAIREAEGPHLG